MSIVYLEHAPAPALRAHVECYWSIASSDAGAGASCNRVLPDGCMDVIFDLSHAGGGVIPWRACVVGTMTRSVVTQADGNTDLFGVRFRPGAAPALLDVPAHELTDRTAPLDPFWSGAPSLLDELASSAALERVRSADAFLRRRLACARALPPVVSAAAAEIARARGLTSVRGLRELTSLEPRTLERVFRQHVGISPRTAIRVVRFRHAVNAALGRPRVHWARLAADSGYYDQAHLIREFRELAGLTPAALLAERAGAVASVQYDVRAAP